LARIAQDHQSADANYGHRDVERIRRLFGQKIGDEAEYHPPETTSDPGETKNRRSQELAIADVDHVSDLVRNDNRRARGGANARKKQQPELQTP